MLIIQKVKISKLNGTLIPLPSCSQMFGYPPKLPLKRYFPPTFHTFWGEAVVFLICFCFQKISPPFKTPASQKHLPEA